MTNVMIRKSPFSGKDLAILLVLLGMVLLLVGCQSSSVTPDEHTNRTETHNEAVDHKFETIQDPPIAAVTYFAAGQLAESQGNLATAVDQYWKAYKADHKCVKALYRLGVVHCEAEQYPSAIIAWKEYIKATDGNANGYGNLGFCYELASQPVEAEETYRLGITKDPKNTLCRVNYGLMLARFNRIGESMLQLQAVLTPAEAHYNIGSVFEIQGNKERARVEYRKAKDLDPNLTDADSRISTIR